MGLRFRKSVTLAPGLRLNFSGSGIGMSVGPRGASMSIGPSGTFLNAGLPGTGLSYRTRIGGGSSRSRRTNQPLPLAAPRTQMVTITVQVDDDGNISFVDASGNPVSQAMIEASKKQQGDKIRTLIQGKVDEINERIEALGKLHLHTPPPVVASYVAKPYEESPPSAPNLKIPGFFCRWFKSCVERKEAGNIRATLSFEAARERWELARDAFEAQELKEVDFIQRVIAGDVDAVEKYFEAEIQEVIWPRETLITYDVRPDGTFLLNVDLPEIEDMPTKTASAPARGFKLSVKDMGSTWVQKLYMRHIHGIGFRLVGEAFASSHAIKTVVLSAYSQRASKVTGAVSDEYLYSVRVPRLQWSLIEFHQLHHIDVVEALAAFEMRRDMTRTGIFRPIIPITV